ncbi:MAG: hypothetical protein ACRD44_02595 [Bryobacteraceae bacterium]
MTARSLRELLTGAIDYAGLFPPAELGMREAVESYARYRAGVYAWMLGRFIVPAKRLPEFEGHKPDSATWNVSLIGEGAASRADVIADAVELRAPPAAPPADRVVYVEVASGADLAPLARAGFRAKLRTGGVAPENFPSPSEVAAFLLDCHRAGVAFKATAGLHHALRCDSSLGPMHGFLNVLLAAVLVPGGLGAEDTVALLEDRDPAGFRFDEDAAVWRGCRAATGEIAEARRNFAISFGSCSFEEPVEELGQLGWL